MTELLFPNANADGRMGAEYRLDEPLKPGRTDVPLLLWVRVRNTGRVPWPFRGAYPVNLGYHWLDAQGRVVEFEGVRTVLPGDILPGHEVRLEVHAEPPPEPGEYQLVVDMVEENVGWFSLQGVPPLVLPITILPEPKGAPRACIIGALCPIHDAVGNTMVHHLRYFQRRGYQALIFIEHIDYRQPQELRQHMIQMTCEVIRSGITNQYNKRALAFFRSADIYVFHYPLPYTLFESIALVERGVVVLDYHGVTPAHLWDGEGKDGFYAAFRRQQQLWRYADYAIAHSQFTAADLLQSGTLAPEQISLAGLPAPLGRFRPGPKPAALLARYGLRPDQPVLLYVGRIATNKRIEVLIHALAIMRERLPDMVLLLVGDNHKAVYMRVAARLQELAERLGVADKVIFAGLVPDAELPAHYQLADLFVTASLHEGFCIPVVEAMACGVPVVGAHATALPETIGDGGLTFRPDDPADLAAQVLAILEDRPSLEARHAAPQAGAQLHGLPHD